MALANNIRREIDITIREYETRYYDDEGNKIKDPKEQLESEVKQFSFPSIKSAIKYLLVKTNRDDDLY